MLENNCHNKCPKWKKVETSHVQHTNPIGTSAHYRVGQLSNKRATLRNSRPPTTSTPTPRRQRHLVKGCRIRGEFFLVCAGDGCPALLFENFLSRCVASKNSVVRCPSSDSRNRFGWGIRTKAHTYTFCVFFCICPRGT